MRTTVSLDPRILAQLKRRAAESGTSVSKLVEQAVRLFVRTPRSAASGAPFQLVTFGEGGRFSRENIDKAAGLIETDDVERFATRR